MNLLLNGDCEFIICKESCDREELVLDFWIKYRNDSDIVIL